MEYRADLDYALASIAALATIPFAYFVEEHVRTVVAACHTILNAATEASDESSALARRGAQQSGTIKQRGEHLVRSVRLSFLPARVRFDHDAAFWVLLQQVVVRGFVAVKFLAIGRILGPEAIGAVSIALLAVAIAESLSDTGLAQAVVQGRESPTHGELGAVWTTLAARGVLIGLLIAALAPFMSSQFHLGGSIGLLLLAALLPSFAASRRRRISSSRASAVSRSSPASRPRPRSWTARSASSAHSAERARTPC